MWKPNKIQKIILLVITILLCIPAVEIQDGTSGVHWSAADFFLAFVLLAAVGFLIEYTIRKMKSPFLKKATIILIIVLFALLWGELAVGIFDSPIAGD